MGKRGRSSKKDNRISKKRVFDEDVNPEIMDDEIDIFHKQRDIVPLNMHRVAGESDDDKEQPIFDFEEADDEENDEDVDMDDDDTQLTGLAAKIARQQKFLREKMGGAEDEMDEEEEEEEDHAVWSRSKRQYYNADEATSSDEELLAEEEAEVLRMQSERAKYLTMEDFGLEDVSEYDSDREPTLGEIAARGQGKLDSTIKLGIEDNGDTDFEVIKKDLNALSKEEQMDLVYSSAPELVGLLSELNAAVGELEDRVNPLISKLKVGVNATKELVRYLEMKQTLLLCYCQAITCYLLLKSEGHPVRDHPVIGRLVEIKELLDKVKELDKYLPPDLEEILNENDAGQTLTASVQGIDAVTADAPTKDDDFPVPVGESQEVANHPVVESIDGENRKAKEKPRKGQFGVESMKMLKVRAALEEKLRQKGISGFAAPKEKKNKRHLKPINGMLETLDDDATGVDGTKHGLSNGNASSSRSGNLSSLLIAMQKQPKLISGDEDLPKRDDISERRRKHELRVLSRAGIEPEDEAGTLDRPSKADLFSDSKNSELEESEDDFYEQVKQQRAAKLAAKAEKYSRTVTTPALPETVDGKRSITYQMEKNRGLTRARKKLMKNPRKKYRTKHQKAVVRRKGQVREVRKPYGPYGGEASGINAGISRSIRFKS